MVDMTKWQEERAAWARSQARYDWRDYRKVAPKLKEQGIVVRPEMFGCADWEHDPDGHVRIDWCLYGADPKEIDPDYVPDPEVHRGMIGARERQRYPAGLLEDNRYNNDRWGWSAMVDKGIMGDYWRRRGLYYSWSYRGGAI